MKKSYFWGLLIAIMALIPSQNAFADYCTMSSTFSNTDRHLDSFTLTDGVEELTVSSAQPNSGSTWRASYKVYNDHTSKSLTTQPGATLHFKSLSWTGSWMHGYVFIDYNQDETFDASEAVSYNFYSEAGESTGLNSKGESVSNNCGVTAGNMPSWTLPSDLASGSYRLRFKIDWNSLDACGASDIVSNRGCILDLTLNVEAAIPERTIDVTVAPEGAGTVTGAGTAMGNITLTATVTPGYEFVNWTLNGEVVGTDLSYTDASEGDKTYVANFAALTAYPEMSYLYTNGVSQANRYLKEVVATAGETVTTVFSATTETELPKVDPDVTGSATTQGAYVDKTENPIIIPEGTTEFTVNFKAWTTAMTISGTSATTQLNWTQQAVFIDWNNNFCFYEEGENYGKNGDGMPNAEFIAADGFVRTFSVPAGVQPGVYRMRVCYFEPNGNNAEQWQNTIFEKGNCVTRNGKTYDFAVEVQAVVAPSFEVTVSVNDEAMGSAKKVAGENDEFTLTATAKDGYEFVNWTVADAEVSTENPYVFTATENVEVVANFQAVQEWPATMELIATAQTLVAKEGVGYPNATAKAELQAAISAAQANSTIASVAPMQEAINAYYAVTEIEMPVAGNVYAFIGKGYTSASDCYLWNNNGVLSIASYSEGTTELPESAYFSCEVVDGQYMFKTVDGQYYMAFPSPGKNWLYNKSENGLEASASNLTKFDILKIVQTTRVQKATSDMFGQVYMWGCRGNGDSADGDLRYGSMIVKSGAWDGAGEPYCDSTPQSSAFSIVKVDYNVTPVYAVTVNAGVGGTAEASATEVEEGTEVTFTATAAEGYQFVNWTSGEEVVSTENPYTVAVTAEMALTANFELIPVTKYAVSVTTVDGAMGTAEVSETEVEEGEEVTFTATANLGYKFIGWLADGETVSTENPYTTAITAEMALVANFEALTPAIVVTVTPDVERQFSFEVATASKLFIDWGNGELVETETIVASDPDPSWIPYLPTTINGTPVGEGVVKIYGDGITYFDCSYSASYPSKVTSLDVTNATSLIALEACTNEIATLDLSNQSSLLKLTAYSNPSLSTIVWPTTNVLTSVTLNDCALAEIDFSSCTALTALNVNNNTGLGGIDVSALAALTTLRADNIGMTTIDLSANTALKNLYVNNNQLTTVDVSNMVAGLYLYANNNQLTSIVAGESNVTSKSRVQITNNNFTLATLPAFTAISKVGTTGYNYAPQAAMTIATEITEGEELDLSAQNNIVGRASEAQATDYTWYTTDGEEFTSYTEEGGKFVFDVEADTELYCTMTTEAFSSFSGANVFKTTNIVVKALIPAIVVTVTPDVERQFSFEVATASKLFIDWGNGELVETETIVASDPDPSWIPYLPTTINGTPVGEGVVKIYGDGITYFDCSYSASYPSKVTSLDVTNATSLIALEACTNEIATLDLSNQSSLLKLTAYSNPSLSTIVWPTTNVLTSVTLNDCALAEIDFSSCTALTALNVNNNTGLGGIDVSALAALTTLRADNIGMTTIDLSANTALKNLYVNNNQLTTVDVSNMVAGLYLYANNNQLTSIVAGESNVTSKSRVQITNNNFTLATLPAFTAISKVGTTGYNYAPQAAMTIATEITEGEELDLSAQNNIVGRASEAQATDYTWYTTDGEEFTSYTEEGGKFVFDVEADTELYCTMTTEAFSSFSGANAFKTTNIVVKYVAVERKVQFKSSDITMGTVQIISPSQGGTGTSGTGTSGTGTSGTGTSGTGTGSATSGGGQSPWVITTEDVTAQANVQGNAYEFVNWTIGEEVVGTETTYTYTGKEEALIQANFRQKETYKTITIDVRPVVKDEYGTNIVGSVKFQGRSGKTTIIEEGSSLTVVATSKDGYEFSSWKDASTGEDVSFDAEYTFTVAGDINLEAWFSELPVVTTYEFVVSIAPTADYGTITINGVDGTSATVVEGTEVTAVATPAEGKVFDGWYTYMGEELSTELTYTFVATADLAIQAWFADETPEVVEYCTYEGNSTHSQRRLNAFTITDGTNTTAVSSIQPSLRGAIYVDKTDVAFPSYAGATVDFSEFDFKGEWMHAYVYVDYNNDGTFDTTVNADGTTGGELVSFTFYSATDSGTGVNSLGESVANYTIPMVDYLPAFTLPTDLEDGDYRVRVKIDWCHLDPCGHPSESKNTLTENGGCIADFTMSISDFNGVEFTEVGATQVYAADGVIYINGYEGEVKVVNVAGQVVKDVNVDGNDTLEVAAGLYIVVTGDQVTKVVVK